MTNNKYQIFFAVLMMIMLATGVWTFTTDDGHDFYCWSKTIPGTDINGDPFLC